ncbi:T9SS type A sorting domain-containing protein [bacterium]|nr:T9SS type A sorting domain-containing protein [bacterium]
MESWEKRLNHVQPPDSIVPSHRDELRKKLQSTSSHSSHHAMRSVAAFGVLFLLMLGGLTVVYPGWAKDIWRVVLVQTITIRTQEGHNISIKKYESEANLQSGDTSQMIILEAGIDGGDYTGQEGGTITISTADGDKIWIVNGDTAEVENVATPLDEKPEMASDFELQQNYPNPFNPTTQISFEMKQSGPAKLTVYNMMGQEVATLLDGFTDAGHHTVSFNGANLPSGTYLYTLKAGGYQVSKKMTLMK